jgi:hypothetical protein
MEGRKVLEPGRCLERRNRRERLVDRVLRLLPRVLQPDAVFALDALVFMLRFRAMVNPFRSDRFNGDERLCLVLPAAVVWVTGDPRSR